MILRAQGFHLTGVARRFSTSQRAISPASWYRWVTWQARVAYFKSDAALMVLSYLPGWEAAHFAPIAKTVARRGIQSDRAESLPHLRKIRGLLSWRRVVQGQNAGVAPRITRGSQACGDAEAVPPPPTIHDDPVISADASLAENTTETIRSSTVPDGQASNAP